MRNFKLLGAATLLFVAAMTVFACSDDSASTNNTNNPFVPVDASATNTGDSGANNGTDTTTDGGCPNKPAGCFCGTPTTQAQFLNRCTTATALPVNLTVPAASTANIP